MGRDLARPESEGKVGEDVKLPSHLERRVREYFALSDKINFKDFETIVRSEDIIMFLYFDSSRTSGISKSDIVDTLKAFPLNENSPLLECYFGSVSSRCQVVGGEGPTALGFASYSVRSRLTLLLLRNRRSH